MRMRACIQVFQLKRFMGDSNSQGEGQKADGESSSEPEETLVQAGCTAVVAVKLGNDLYVANAGDSRGVLNRGGKALALSEDHKPAHEIERSRIIAAGGFLSEIGGVCRVNGNLNLSRAIGDLKYKANTELPAKDQIISAQPDIRKVGPGPWAHGVGGWAGLGAANMGGSIHGGRVWACMQVRSSYVAYISPGPAGSPTGRHPHTTTRCGCCCRCSQVTIAPEDKFFLLACDGVWDVMSNQDAVDFVQARMDQGMTPTQVRHSKERQQCGMRCKQNARRMQGGCIALHHTFPGRWSMDGSKDTHIHTLKRAACGAPGIGTVHAASLALQC